VDETDRVPRHRGVVAYPSRFVQSGAVPWIVIWHCGVNPARARKSGAPTSSPSAVTATVRSSAALVVVSVLPHGDGEGRPGSGASLAQIEAVYRGRNVLLHEL
jgi:hypothetical protein